MLKVYGGHLSRLQTGQIRLRTGHVGLEYQRAIGKILLYNNVVPHYRRDAMPNPKTYILDDLPTDEDTLDFKPYIETLVDVCKTASTPLTIGVFGTWGSGKTSLMKMVRNGIPGKCKGLPENFTVAWFDAWKYDKEETLWRAFLLSVLSAVRNKVEEGEPTEDLDFLETMLYRAIDIEKEGGVTIDLLKLGSKVAQGAVQIGLSFIPGAAALGKIVEELQKAGTENIGESALDAIQRERTKIHIEQVKFLEQFQNKFRTLVEQHVTNNGGRLVVFVDDLDRCLPEKAIEVLEAIKLFVDAPGCIFVLGLDQDVIARGIEMKYKELGEKKDGDEKRHFTIEGIKYLEKIIQLPFQIPPVEQTDMGDFVHGLTAEWPHEECPKIFAVGLGDNPRQIKRTVNVFLMLWNLAEKRKEKLEGRIKPIRLAKVVAIQAIYPELYDLLKEAPRYLRELEEYYRQEPQEMDKRIAGDVPRVGLDLGEKDQEAVAKIEPPPALVNFVSRLAIRRILTLHAPEFSEANFSGLKPDELRLYFTLTRRAEAPKAEPAETPRQAFEPQMVRIPAGKFLMGSSPEQAQEAIKDGADKSWVEWEQPQHEVELSEYSIGKYPVTNREYQAFIKDMGYKPPQGWDVDQYPAEKGDHPVVYVSWEDANAFCKWLSEKTSKAYRLPTEAEWERAARGEDGRIWSWGNEFGEKNANTVETNIGDTTSVGQFSPQGDSPYGCADMIGNVWEWCADWFDKNEYKKRHGQKIENPQGPQKGDGRVLRGGSFFSFRRDARCALRRRNLPSLSLGYYGFRVAVSPILKSEP
jgi:formylglycine-generating enzyme required for sulfatase activity